MTLFSPTQPPVIPIDPTPPERGLLLDRVELSLRGVTLVRLEALIAPGEIATVMGPSGSGKSTLLAYLSGALDPAFSASGRVLLNGRDITALPPERRRIGILFQEALLFPHLSVGSNLALALPPSVRGRRERRRRATAALAHAGLEGYADRDPATLSGGQKARVALMRTLLAEPAALLLDEPFAKLDVALRARIRSFVFEEIRLRGLPALLVTHDPADAEAAGGTVYALAGGDGEPGTRAPGTAFS